jgi:nucleoid-associated protein YgaU
MPDKPANNSNNTSSKDPKEKTKDNLALVVGGLFILALVFAAYNYFSKGAGNQNKLADQNLNFIENNSNNATSSIDGNGATTSNTTDTNSTNEITGQPAQTGGTSTTPSASVTTASATTWVANSYNPGDIKAGSYTVKSGDTLWEIAVAKYGNGAEWGKILAANKGAVGFLPNGEQALIVPGQVLVLP